MRDLHSTNGTLVNGKPVSRGVPMALAKGDRLSFGCPDETYQLLDDGPPELFARRLADGFEVRGPGAAHVSRMHDALRAQVVADALARSTGSDMPRVRTREFIDADGEQWQVYLPLHCAEDTKPLTAETATVDKISLTFIVSADEEQVAIDVEGIASGHRHTLEARSHNYLLLHLARLRLGDHKKPTGERGWIQRGELASALRLDATHLNVQLLRLRRSFAELGLADVGNLFEARGRPGELRIGVQRLQIRSQARV